MTASTLDNPRSTVLDVLAAPFTPRTWREFGFLIASVIMTTIGFFYAVAALSIGVSLAIFVIGIPVLAILIVGARGLALVNRSLARSLLGSTVADPPPFRRDHSLIATAGHGALDSDGWRSIAYQFVAWPLSLFTSIASATVLGSSLALMTQWIWAGSISAVKASDGTMHHGVQINGDFFLDTPLREIGGVIVGFALLLVWPYLNRGLVVVHRHLIDSLLGSTRFSRQIVRLSQARSDSVVDHDARLSEIERNLHDGAQAQLVAVAMKIGDAKERLAAGEDPATVLPLLESAHTGSKEAVSDLRDLARGIRPPILANGLGAALDSVAARCPIPVRLQVDLPERPSPPIESVAYFGASELVTNAVKHAGASRIDVRLSRRDDRLRLEVEDDGTGGARIAEATGSGLAGLAHRARAVDGVLTIVSPPGGPTVVSVDLPYEGV